MSYLFSGEGTLSNVREISTAKSGSAMAVFFLKGSNYRGRDEDDNPIFEDFGIEVVVFGRDAEKVVRAGNKKGARVTVSGKLTQRTYEYNGENRTTYQVIANNIKRVQDLDTCDELPEWPTKDAPSPKSKKGSGKVLMDVPF